MSVKIIMTFCTCTRIVKTLCMYDCACVRKLHLCVNAQYHDIVCAMVPERELN